MKLLKKLLLVLLCIAMLAIFTGCDDAYKTTKSAEHYYNLGEIAEIVYGDSERPEFVFRINYFTYNKDGSYTLFYDHTSYRSDFDFEIMPESDNFFSIVRHDNANKSITVKKSSDASLLEDVLYLHVKCPNYVGSSRITLNHTIDLNDNSMYVNPSLDDYMEQFEEKYNKKMMYAKETYKREIRISTAISILVSLLIVVAIILINVYLPTNLHNKISEQQTALSSIDVISPDFQKYKPCATRPLGIISFVISLFALFPCVIFLSGAEKAIFFPTFVPILTFSMGAVTYALRMKLYEKHGLDITSMILSLPPICMAFAFLF